MDSALEVLAQQPNAKPVLSESKENPANHPGRASGERKRIPMSVPVQKLSVPDIPGFHLHWMRGDEARIRQAQRAGYDFVRPEEVEINSVGIGESTAISGNSDLGDRVSVTSGDDIGFAGQPGRLILMKIRLDWWNEDRKELEDRNEQVAASLRGDTFGAETLAGDANPGDPSHRYVDKQRREIPDMFKRKVKKP